MSTIPEAQVRTLGTATSADTSFLTAGQTSLLTPALISCYSLPVAMTFPARALNNSLGYKKSD